MAVRGCVSLCARVYACTDVREGVHIKVNTLEGLSAFMHERKCASVCTCAQMCVQKWVILISAVVCARVDKNART